MYYKLRVTKQEENPQYEAQLKDYRKRDTYKYDNPEALPSQFIVKDCLEVIVDEKQYKAIQKAVLEQFN